MKREIKESRLAKRRMGQDLKKPPKKRRKLKKILAGLFLFLVFVSVLFYLLSPRKWDGVSKVSIAAQEENGNVNLRVFDPSSSSITTFEIPAETQVKAAKELGTWKLGSITRLGIERRVGVDFLKNTLIKSFGFPIDEETDTRESNFSMVDRIRLFLFSLQVSQANKYYIDLTKTRVLTKGRLTDGTEGYKINDIPTNIKSYFVTDNKSVLNVIINNFIMGQGSAFMVSKMLDTLGVNVASIQDKQPDQGLDCVVVGLSKDVATKISKILGCKYEERKALNNFDIEVNIGQKFSDRF